jgi:Holliday junction DNA helicase RuvA
MITGLQGRLRHPEIPPLVDAATVWVVEVETDGGVTYQVQVPRGVWERLPSEGERVSLRIHEVRREDAHLLFGFLTSWEAALFALLLTAQGIGPRIALAMLSTLSTSLLIRAIQQRDLATLSQVPGVGKKVAERLAVALSDRVEALVVHAGPGMLLGLGASDSVAPDEAASAALAAVKALQGLGMRIEEADALVQRTLAESPGLSPDELVRRALASVR